jgi:hypothetical protein
MKSHEVLKKVVQDGTVKKVASDIGVSKETLYKMRDGTNPDYAKRVIDITKATGDLDLVKFICMQTGGYYVGMSNECPHDLDIAKTVKEFGEFLATYSGGYADGKLTKKERYDILKEGAEAVAAIEYIMQKVAEF